MSMTQTVLQGADTASQAVLYVSFELGDKKWKVTAGDGRIGPSQYAVDAGDKETVLNCLRKAKRSAASLIRSSKCTRAMRLAATGGGCTAG